MAFASKAQERRAKRLAAEGLVSKKKVEKDSKESKDKDLPERSQTKGAKAARRKKHHVKMTELVSQYSSRFEYPRSE